MKIVQKKIGHRVQVELRDDDFVYTVRDLYGTKTFKVRYFDFEPDPLEEFQENRLPALFIGSFFFIMGVAQFLMRGSNEKLGISGPIWILIGVLALLVYKLRLTTHILHATREGSVVFLKDEKYDEILRQISARRNSMLKAELDLVDPTADLAQEIAKFQWLREQGVLSDEELSERIREVHAFAEEALAGDQESEPN